MKENKTIKTQSNSRFLFWPVFALALTAFSMSTFLMSIAQANPRLTVSNPDFDFGFVPTNCDVSYRYWLYSTGSSDLHIKWTDPSCPCAQLPLSTKVVAPEDSVGLELILTTGRVAGAITRKPYIQTDADSEPSRLKFTAKVIPGDTKAAKPLGISPFRADLSSIGSYFQDTARIVMYNNSEYPIELSLVYSAPEYFSVSLPQEIQAGESDTSLVILNRNSAKATESAFAKSFTVEVSERVVGDNNLISRFTVPVRRKFSP